jgi:hypothetical protein
MFISKDFPRIAHHHLIDSKKSFIKSNYENKMKKNFNNTICISDIESPLKINKNDSKEPKNIHPWIKDNVFNLFTFLNSIFNYECKEPNINSLSFHEKQILTCIIQTKDYSNKTKLIEILQNKTQPEPNIWNQFKKIRRKEEYLKYGFKMIFKQMQGQFIKEFVLKDSMLALAFDSSDHKLFFYLHTFGEISMGKSKESLLVDLKNGRLSKVKAWRQMSKFILPEMGISNDYCGVKTINREFIKSLSRLRGFSLKFLDRVIDIFLFLSYFWSINFSNFAKKKKLSIRDQNGINILQNVAKINQKEIKKLFSEWGNLIKKQPKKLKSTDPELNNNKRNFNLIKKSIQRTNFKFPWTFVEVLESTIETFISFVEFINFDHLPSNSKSNKNYTNNF